MGAPADTLTEQGIAVKAASLAELGLWALQLQAHGGQ